MHAIVGSSRTGLVVAAAAVAIAGSLAAATLVPGRSTAVTVAVDTIPSGYHSMTVGTISPLYGGEYSVDLVDGDRAITIYVGQSEGMAIELRNEGRKFVRPLTADLLDDTMAQLGGTLDRIQVDSIIGGTYHGSLHLHQGGKSLRIDARPSDAIALAIGNHVPILVADSVIAEAGHPRN
jgi:bifunctional DNase/RNase